MSLPHPLGPRHSTTAALLPLQRTPSWCAIEHPACTKRRYCTRLGHPACTKRRHCTRLGQLPSHRTCFCFVLLIQLPTLSPIFSNISCRCSSKKAVMPSPTTFSQLLQPTTPPRKSLGLKEGCLPSQCATRRYGSRAQSKCKFAQGLVPVWEFVHLQRLV